MATAEINGIQLYYEEYGSGFPIVFAHGAGGNHMSWWQQVPVLSRHYRCVTFDHRGWGLSLDVDDRGPAAFIKDLTRFIDYLGFDKTFLVAQSMGGLSCLGFAIRHPERVRGLVMANTFAGMRRDVWLASNDELRLLVFYAGGGRAQSPAADVEADRSDLIAVENPAHRRVGAQIAIQLVGADEREQAHGAPEDLSESLVGDLPLETGVLHGAAEDGVTTAGEHVSVADVVQDGGGSVGGPGRHRHLAADRLDREVTGEAFEPGRPGAGGEYHALGGDRAAGSAHAGHAAVGDADLLDRLGNECRPEPAGVRQ